jgi:soluble lytic murein transglycosylase-like protein
MFRPVFLTTCIVFLAAPGFADEFAILSSGMTIRVDRHEISGDIVRLYRGKTVTELPRATVTGFEPDDTPPPASPAETPRTAAAPSAQAQPPAPAPKPADPRAMVRDAAARAGLPAAFVESVAKTESAFNPAAISPKGAIGVMQLMPETAKAMGAQPNDPAQNIEAGAQLLRQLLLKYNGDVVKALAAYNAGEGAVDRYQGVPPYPETQHYVNTVVRDYLKSTGNKSAGQ